jgi:hypothetical protein
MTFQVVSVGWSCADWLEQTLRSIEMQSVQDFRVMVVYDGGDNGGDLIRQWCDNRDDRWNYQINEKQQWAVRNQYEAVQMLSPEDDDILVFLDLDGDQLAHPQVFEHLLGYYADSTLLTYGNYRPVPWADTCPPAVPFPPEVVQNASYRNHVMSGAGCCFNHLRTMKAKVYKSIPLDRLKRPNGEWYESGTDYVVIIPGLELAGGRYKCIEEVLLLYNNANPLADYIVHPSQTTGNIRDAMERPPLAPL